MTRRLIESRSGRHAQPPPDPPVPPVPPLDLPSGAKMRATQGKRVPLIRLTAERFELTDWDSGSTSSTFVFLE